MVLGRFQGGRPARALVLSLVFLCACATPRVSRRPFTALRPIFAGERAEALAPDEAPPAYRDAIARALAERDAAAHNQAVERLLRVAGVDQDLARGTERLAAAGVSLRVAAPTWAPLDFDRLLIAADYRVANVGPTWRREGWGVPLVAARSLPGTAEERPPPYRSFADEYRLAGTAVARLEGPDEARSVVIEVRDPHDDATVAADLTTPLAMLLGHRDMAALEYQGLLNPGLVWPRSGVFMITPYQPGKIPVLFVHGIWSSPRTWLTMINALQGDPEVRARYQFWVAVYATGHSIPVSAWRLRASLRDLRGALDPAAADPALGRMVVVTHSMGGLVGKLLAVESGDALRQAVLRVPLERLEMSDETRAFVSEVMHFRADPMVARMLFIGVPHRGSRLANRFDAWLGSALIRRDGPGPDAIREVRRLNGPDIFQPDVGAQPLSGATNLEQDEPLLLAFERMPRAPWTAWHSIIGILEGREALEGGPTDGVVAYRSAHLDDVPETIVPGSHVSLHHRPDTIEIVRQHLYEHAGIDRTAGPPRVVAP